MAYFKIHKNLEDLSRILIENFIPICSGRTRWHWTYRTTNKSYKYMVLKSKMFAFRSDSP